MTDQVWQLEEALWAATTTGEVAHFYVHTLSDDATIIVAGHRLRRDDVLTKFGNKTPPWTQFAMSDRETVLETHETIVLTYRLITSSPTIAHPYRGQVTSVYRWTPRGWALALRQHTADPDVAATSWFPPSLTGQAIQTSTSRIPT